MFTKEELATIMGMIGFTWENGGVRSEAQAMTVHNMKVKVAKMMEGPSTEVPVPPGTPGKKDDCGNCKDKDKDKVEKKPDGPPKAAPMEVPEPKAEEG